MTEGRKFDAGKPEFSLIPPWALEAVARVMTIGAQKYDVDNWKIVPNGEYRYKNAAGRHINDYLKGNFLDPETGEHHLAHAICCLMFILDAYESQIPLAGKIVETPPAPIDALPSKKGAELSGIAYMSRGKLNQALFDAHTNAPIKLNSTQN